MNNSLKNTEKITITNKKKTKTKIKKKTTELA